MHMFKNIKCLRNMIEETSTGVVSILSNEYSIDEILANITFREAGCCWILTSLVIKKA